MIIVQVLQSNLPLSPFINIYIPGKSFTEENQHPNQVFFKVRVLSVSSVYRNKHWHWKKKTNSWTEMCPTQFDFVLHLVPLQTRPPSCGASASKRLYSAFGNMSKDKKTGRTSKESKNISCSSNLICRWSVHFNLAIKRLFV